MAVDIELLPANSINNINTNFERVEEALQDTIGRSGDTPNQMNADLDLNGNDILNGGVANFEDIFVDNVPIDQVVGIQGPVGPQGPIGNTGPQGPVGDQGPTGQGLDFDVQVDDLPARDAYDNEPEGFRILVSDNGTGAAIYSRESATPGVWSSPAYIGTSSEAIIGPASSISNNLLSFSNITGKNAKDSGVPSDKIVRVDTVQSFSSGEQQQARDNINATSPEDVEDLFQLHAVPIGTIIMQNGAVDPGFLRIGEGGSFDRASYPDLADWMDLNGSALGLSPSQIANGEFPDWRDYSPRTAGGPLGPAVGELQEDALQQHGHRVQGLPANLGNGTPYDLGRTNSTADTGDLTGTGSAPTAYRDDEVVQIVGARVSDDETRVKSFGVRWQIKAYGALVNQGMADLVAIEQAVQEVRDGAVFHDRVQALSASDKKQARINIGASLETIYDVDLAGLAQVDWPDLHLFDCLEFDIEYIGPSALAARLSLDNGATFQSGANAYSFAARSSLNGNGWTYSTRTSSDRFGVSGGAVGNEGTRILGAISSASSAVAETGIIGTVYYSRRGILLFDGYYGGDVITNAIRFYSESGTFTAGRAVLKGIRK